VPCRCWSCNFVTFYHGELSHEFLIAAVGVTAFLYAPVMIKLFHIASISAASWLRIPGMAAAVFVVVEEEKWLRFGRGRGDHAIPA